MVTEEPRPAGPASPAESWEGGHRGNTAQNGYLATATDSLMDSDIAQTLCVLPRFSITSVSFQLQSVPVSKLQMYQRRLSWHYGTRSKINFPVSFSLLASISFYIKSVFQMPIRTVLQNNIGGSFSLSPSTKSHVPLRCVHKLLLPRLSATSD